MYSNPQKYHRSKPPLYLFHLRMPPKPTTLDDKKTATNDLQGSFCRWLTFAVRPRREGVRLGSELWSDKRVRWAHPVKHSSQIELFGVPGVVEGGDPSCGAYEWCDPGRTASTSIGSNRLIPFMSARRVCTPLALDWTPYVSVNCFQTTGMWVSCKIKKSRSWHYTCWSQICMKLQSNYLLFENHRPKNRFLTDRMYL